MVDRAAAGQTVFLSSHQIVEVERVADIVAIVHQGDLVLIERLDELKAQVREVTLTMSDGQVALPNLPGELLAKRQKGRQWQVMVRGLGDEQVAGLCGVPGVREVESRVPSLEEIFVAYIQRGRENTILEVPTP
jgi:ABC-2 type transport system ATP-binding protein